jgi:hypothetical protein
LASFFLSAPPSFEAIFQEGVIYEFDQEIEFWKSVGGADRVWGGAAYIFEPWAKKAHTCFTFLATEAHDKLYYEL